jgi:hypothetical protein
MNQQLAKEIFDSISATKLDSFKSLVFKKAIDYSHIRAQWAFADRENRYATTYCS